ncbi:metal-sensitive transcriptional regulator [Tessaracoccus sp. SD287]|nr:metal-sensitive transcriptional regulator [Tessaracoccus sp. SD287]MBO1030245.1 metal-sensitive transcriptional regulator [Tessaracoccus sp. SD287]
MPDSGTDRRMLIARLSRIEGQVRGLSLMITRDAACVDILTQVSAVTHALDSLALKLLDDHLRRCVGQADTDASALTGQAHEAALATAGLLHRPASVTELTPPLIES